MCWCIFFVFHILCFFCDYFNLCHTLKCFFFPHNLFFGKVLTSSKLFCFFLLFSCFFFLPCFCFPPAKGLTREEAYKRVEKALHEERMGDVEIARDLVKEASALSGGRPSFVSDEGVYDGLRQWQAILRETP